MARLRSAQAPPSATAADSTRRPALREKTNTTGTPGPAVETSMLALKNFKRRPRQGSMLEMVKHRRSSVARQSLASVQPQEQEEHENTSVFDLGSASEDEEDFVPEAEGTPVHVSKMKGPASARTSLSATKSKAPASATRRSKRKSDEMETSHSALDALKKKHRKSDVPSVDDEPLPAAHASLDRPASPSPVPASDVQVVNSSPGSTPTVGHSSAHKESGDRNGDFAVPSTEEQERQQSNLDAADNDDALNATMADPASSSPIASPIPETQQTDIYADPLTQASPPPRQPAKTRSRGDAKRNALSTATLRALLPKRTRRPQPRHRRTEYDISDEDEDEQTAYDTTNLDEEEDELGGRLQRKAKASTQSKGRKKPTTAAKSKPKQKATAKKAPPAAKSTKGKATRTYGRGAASDKENDEANDPASEQGEEEEEDASMTMHEVAHSKELEEARRKFAEVDEWDLSFESMSNEDHRSSSQGWR